MNDILTFLCLENVYVKVWPCMMRINCAWTKLFDQKSVGQGTNYPRFIPDKQGSNITVSYFLKLGFLKQKGGQTISLC